MFKGVEKKKSVAMLYFPLPLRLTDKELTFRQKDSRMYADKYEHFI